MPDDGAPAERGERRWPMAAAVLATAVLHQFFPAGFRVSPHWIYPAFLAAFLVVLIIGDPGRIDRERHWLRVTTGCMIGLITVVNAFSALRLIVNILGHGRFNTASELLSIGAIVWLVNVIAFALWFWDLDGGGAAARATGSTEHSRALVFPEMTLDELAPPNWYPQFIDYLAVSFNTATAFGPTDVSAIKPWAKLMMITESVISLALATLVIARAINIL
jgi:hypothetical protein